MEQTCSTCHYWRKVFDFDEQATCIPFGCPTAHDYANCHQWREREPDKIPPAWDSLTPEEQDAIHAKWSERKE